jgi:glycosyltransferase involved in cell wall biosynthesis
VSKRKNIPLIVVYDAPVLEEYSFFHGKKQFYKNLVSAREEATLNQASVIVVYSLPVKEFIRKKISADKNIVIHQNIDFTRFDFFDKSLKAGTINIGFIGSFLRWHRVDLLINAFNRLRESDVDVKLYLVGDGMEFKAIEGIVKASPFSNDIILTGFLDGDALKEIKKKLHIGVMPGSNWYGAPNKIFEYGAAQIAVVAPDTPTIKDLFADKDNIMLFSQDSESDLFQKLKTLTDDPVLLSRIAGNLKEKVKNDYSREKTLSFYKRIMDRAVNGDLVMSGKV